MNVEQELLAVTADGEQKKLIIQLTEPSLDDRTWWCPVSIRGLHSDGPIAGGTALQSLCLALQTIERHLQAFVDKGGQLSYPDGSPWAPESYFGERPAGPRWWSDDLEQELYPLEESLWISKTRFDRHYMDRLLARDFVELGRSGRRYGRQEILDMEERPIDAVVPLRNFQVRMLGEEVALATYVSELRGEAVEVANRSSVWRRRGKTWQLEFHQGTPVDEDEGEKAT